MMDPLPAVAKWVAEGEARGLDTDPATFAVRMCSDLDRIGILRTGASR